MTTLPSSCRPRRSYPFPRTSERIVWCVVGFHPAYAQALPRAIHQFTAAHAALTREAFREAGIDLGQGVAVRVSYYNSLPTLQMRLRKLSYGWMDGEGGG